MSVFRALSSSKCLSCSNIFFFAMQKTIDGNNYTIIYLLYTMFWSYVCIFLFCEFGEQVCTGFSDIGVAIDQLEWYLLPGEMWQTLLIVKVVAHKSFGFIGFGRASCAREIFKRVIRIECLCSF